MTEHARSPQQGSAAGAQGSEARMSSNHSQDGTGVNVNHAQGAEDAPELPDARSDAPELGIDDMGNMASEIESLALSSDLTELSMSIDTVFTLLFEVQELRHTTAQPDTKKDDEHQHSVASPAGGAVDEALDRLDLHVQKTAAEVINLQNRLTNYWEKTPSDFLRRKWDEVNTQWQRATLETEKMREELVEDKYLVVYRTVSKQAEDMMHSLEKIFNQCHTFVHGLNDEQAMQSTSSGDPNTTTSLKANLETFMTLHKSLHQKQKYYIPSCERVLKVIDSGIAQQKTLNGEVIKSHSDMKMKWRNLKERSQRVELEMQAVQDLLSKFGEGGQMEGSSSSESRRSSVSTPSRPDGSVRRRTSDWLDPSPKVKKTVRASGSPASSRAVSPFRRLANKLKPSPAREAVPPLPASLPSSRVSSQSAATSAEANSTPLNKVGLPISLFTPLNDRPALKPRQSAPHRQTQSISHASGLGPPPLLPPVTRPSYGSTVSSRMSERSRSPAPRPSTSQGMNGGIDNRPRWNSSTRLPSQFMTPLSSRPAFSGRQSLSASSGPLRAISPSPSAGRLTPMTSRMYSRPASRNFTAPSFRPASPAFSTTSNMSAARTRPPSAQSKIPGPSPSRPSTRKKSSSMQPGLPDFEEMEDGMETLSLGYPSQANVEGRLRGASSPTPSSSTAGGRRYSQIPRLSVSGAFVHPESPTTSDSSLHGIMTPEPTMRMRAARVSALFPVEYAMTGGLLRHYSQDTPSQKTYTPSGDSEEAALGPYEPNPYDLLDTEIATILNSQPLFVPCKRVDPHLTKAAAEAQGPGDRIARYSLGWEGGKDVACKLIDRGPQKGRKVLVKTRAGWQDLALYLLDLQAQV